MNLKLIYLMLIVQAINARNLSFKQEEIIKTRLQDQRHSMLMIRDHHFGVLEQLNDSFARNFTAIVDHGRFVTAYLLRKMRFQIENLQFEGKKQGKYMQHCVDEIDTIVDVLPSTAETKINVVRRTMIDHYTQVRHHFEQQVEFVDTGLKQVEHLLLECLNQRTCFTSVMNRIDIIERFISEEFLNDIKSKIEDFLMMMQLQFHSAQGVYLTLYEDIKSNEVEFVRCYQDGGTGY